MSDNSNGYILEFNHYATGLGQPAVEASITKREAMLCVKHWMEMLCAVKGNWACGTSGTWECGMWQYANYRIRVLRDSGAISEDEIQAISDSIEWPDLDMKKEFEEMHEAYIKEHAEELNPANWSSDEFLTELNNPRRSETGHKDSLQTDTNDTIDW